MYHHPWISAVVGVGTNLVFLGSIVLMSFAMFLSPSPHSTPETSDVVDDTEDRGGNDTVEVPRRSAPVRLSLWFCCLLRTILVSTLKLSLLVTLVLISYQAYLHETYNPSELAEITYNEVISMMDHHYHKHQETYKLFIDFLSNTTGTEDIMVQLLIVKVTFIVLIVFVISMTKYIVG